MSDLITDVARLIYETHAEFADCDLPTWDELGSTFKQPSIAAAEQVVQLMANAPASVQGAADGEVCTPPMGIANETACLLAPMHAGLCEPPVPTHPNAEGADADGEAQA